MRRITVSPDGDGDVTITLPAICEGSREIAFCDHANSRRVIEILLV